MKHVFPVRIGPVGFRIGSDWRAPIARLSSLYADYPAPQGGVPDFNVRLFAARPWRRFVRPAVIFDLPVTGHGHQKCVGQTEFPAEPTGPRGS